jgi:hypothetical protein
VAEAEEEEEEEDCDHHGSEGLKIHEIYEDC